MYYVFYKRFLSLQYNSKTTSSKLLLKKNQRSKKLLHLSYLFQLCALRYILRVLCFKNMFFYYLHMHKVFHINAYLT